MSLPKKKRKAAMVRNRLRKLRRQKNSEMRARVRYLARKYSGPSPFLFNECLWGTMLSESEISRVLRHVYQRTG